MIVTYCYLERGNDKSFKISVPLNESRLKYSLKVGSFAEPDELELKLITINEALNLKKH